ncbi:hypothetical protein AB0I81_10415 [Nonomuraea sp. NPDC050404]|uniref:hypothetical protein n=1 Tax=Nonomuraea sp. NPDC050404 TaxID=3155783 RepID=UPI0034032A8B
MSGYTTVPYVIAYSNELVKDPIWFEQTPVGQPRLSYQPPGENDWVGPGGVRRNALGILRARVLDLRDQASDVRGCERMRKLNTLRQWKCMDDLLCQVCGYPAVDLETGLLPWLLVRSVFERNGLDSGRTNAPPCCWACVPKALAECRMLQDESVMVCTATGVTSVGVLADLYEPTPITGRPMPHARNIFIPWTNRTWHSRSFAVAQVVELHGIRPVAAPP